MAQTYDRYEQTDENGNVYFVDGLGNRLEDGEMPKDDGIVSAGFGNTPVNPKLDGVITAGISNSGGRSALDLFVDLLGPTPEEQAKYDNSGVGGWLKYKFGLASEYKNPLEVAADIIAKRTPDQLLDALEEAGGPEAKGAIEHMRKDPEFKEALKDAFAKDTSVLKGMSTLFGKDSAFSPDELEKLLSDPKNRQLLTGLLKGVANDPKNNPDGKDLVFNDMMDAMNAGLGVAKDPFNAEKRKKYKELLAQFGTSDNRMDMLDDPMQAFQMFLDDPSMFAQMIFDNIKDILPEEYHDLVAGIVDGFAHGAAAFVDPKGDWAGYYVQGTMEIAESAGPQIRERGQNLIAGTSSVTEALGIQASVDEVTEQLKKVAGIGKTDIDEDSLGSKVALAGDNDNGIKLNVVAFNPSSSGDDLRGGPEQQRQIVHGAHVFLDKAAAAPSMMG